MAASSSLSMVIKLVFDSGKTLSNTKSLVRSVGELAGAFAGLKLVQTFAEANREIEGLVRGLNAISGGNGNAYLEQLYTTANRLGVPIKEVAQSFLELNAAAANTAFEGQKTQALFESLANALSTTGADAVRFNRGFRAMAQILSKDQLFAEELRQQLGEALPTAIQDFSRALKINPQQLFKFMEAGVISGDQLRRTLVLVSQEWKRSYKVLEEQDFTVDQKIAMVRNQIQALLVAVGQTGVWTEFGDSLLTIRDILNDITTDIPAFGDEVKAQFELYSNVIQSTIDLLDGYFPTLKTNIEAAFQAIDPQINFDTLKAQFLELPIEIANAIIPSIESLRLFLVEAENLIKNFNAKNGIDVTGDVDVGAYIQNFSYSLGQEAREGLGTAWDYFKGLVSEPLVIRPEIVPLTKEEYKQQSLAPVGLQDREYARYVKRIEEANQKIREQNALARQTNTEINKNNAEEVAKVASIKKVTQAYQESINTIRDEYRIKKDINASLRESDRLENQRRGFHQSYLANIKQEESAKQKSLIISKQQFKLDKDLINLQQAYRDSLEAINTSKYQRWADQGQITQEAAQFFAKSAKDESLRKAWVEAQDAVEAYNQEAGRGAQANKDTLAALKGLAEDQLAYANSKAKEVGDEYKLKQIFEARTGLLQSQLKLMEDFDKVLQRAENPKQVDVGLNPVQESSVKKVVDQVQSSINAQPSPTVLVDAKLKPTSLSKDAAQSINDTQVAVNQYSPIFIKTVLQAPIIPSEITAPLIQQMIVTPVSIPVTLDPEKDTLSLLINDFQKAIKGLPSGVLSTTVTVDTQNLKSSMESVHTLLQPKDKEIGIEYQVNINEEKIKAIVTTLGLLDESFNDNQVTAWLKTLAGFDTFPLDKIEGIRAAIQRVNETLAQPGTLETQENSLRIKALLEELLQLKQAAEQPLPVEVTPQPIKTVEPPPPTTVEVTPELKPLPAIPKTLVEVTPQLQLPLSKLDPLEVEVTPKLQPFVNPPTFSAPVFLNFLDGAAAQIEREWQAILQAQKTPGFLTGPVTFEVPDASTLQKMELPPVTVPPIQLTEVSGSTAIAQALGDSLVQGIQEKLSGLKTDFLSKTLGEQGRLSAIAFGDEFASIFQQLLKNSKLGISELQGTVGAIGVNVFLDPVSRNQLMTDFQALTYDLSSTVINPDTSGLAKTIEQQLTNIRVIPILDDQFLSLFSNHLEEMKAKGRVIDPFSYLEDTSKIQQYFTLYKELMKDVLNPEGGLRVQNLLDPNRFGVEDLANAESLRQEMEAIFAPPIQQQVAVVTPSVVQPVQGLAEEDASLASSVLDIYRSVVTTIFGIIPAANAAEDSLQGVQDGFAQASTEASRFNQSLQDRPLVVTPEVPKNWLIDELNRSRQLLSGFKPLFEIQANANQVVTEGTAAGVAAAQAANQALAQNPVTLTAKTNLPQVTQELQTVGQQARTTVAELQKINQLPPGTYTIQAANPAEQQSIEDKVKLLQQNQNLTVNVQWVTTGGETVDGFTKGIEKKAVVTITAKANPAQAAAEGAKVGQATVDAANQTVAQNPITITAVKLDPANIQQGFQAAMDQAKSTVKTSVAEMNQELVQKLGTQGVQVKIETVVDQTSFEGWQRQVQRLSAQDNRVPLRADTAELDQEFRRIDGQFAEWNRTAGAGLSAGFVTATQQAQNFGTLVDQVNQKMRAIQNPQALPPIKPVIEPVLPPKSVYDQVQDQLNQQNPITISADAAPMIGTIQKELDALRASGATNIKVTVDENTGKLVVTADTVPATNSVKELIASINANPAVQTVNVVFNVPELSLPDKTQYVNVVYRDSGSSSGSEKKNRWGGYISGYGGGDRIRALLEPGEFVLRKEAVKALGLSSLIKLNNMGFNAKIPKPSARSVDQLPIPRFASGGMVTGQPIVINVPGGKSIQVQGSRDSAMALANLLTRVGRAV